ncbi:hypothetical protein STCU_12245 [Strigomonas culicis]|uniref:Uncharacterized protein n=1 Tax=Strigomonas culicis TaxID=28005 RepID=S9UKN1_9TRYP|nr:hypothetical protein STCU_12245 [Strigomonas culicis]|eukprot:EPY15211.1 hypothetical protein STCU_12245 [Strigomonas culicis]
MFNISDLTASQRSGQIGVTMHLIVAIAIFCFSGALGALGPLTSYKHWTLSTFICLLCGIGVGISILIIYCMGGVYSPDGKLLLGGRNSNTV